MSPSTLHRRNLRTEVLLWKRVKCLPQHYTEGIWERRFYSDNASNVSINTSQEEFENGGFTLKTRQVFSVHTTPEKLWTQQSPVVLDLFEKNSVGKSHDYRDYNCRCLLFETRAVPSSISGREKAIDYLICEIALCSNRSKEGIPLPKFRWIEECLKTSAVAPVVERADLMWRPWISTLPFFSRMDGRSVPFEPALNVLHAESSPYGSASRIRESRSTIKHQEHERYWTNKF